MSADRDLGQSVLKKLFSAIGITDTVELENLSNEMCADMLRTAALDLLSRTSWQDRDAVLEKFNLMKDPGEIYRAITTYFSDQAAVEASLGEAASVVGEAWSNSDSLDSQQKMRVKQVFDEIKTSLNGKAE